MAKKKPTQKNDTTVKLITSPSNLNRLMACAGSGALEATLPSLPAGASAERGTRVHALLEALMTGNKPDGAIFPNGVDAIELALATKAFASIKNVIDEHQVAEAEIEVHAEHEIDLRPLGFDRTGTIDVVAVVPGKFAIVFDLKTGVWPQHADSWQMKAYALACWQKWKVEMVVTVIVQPEADVVDEFIMPIDEMMLMLDTIEERLALARTPDAPFTPTRDGCKWCRAVSVCPAFVKNPIVEAKMQMTATEIKKMQAIGFAEFFETLTPTDRATFYENLEQAQNWIDGIKEEIKRACDAGNLPEGYEMKSARVDRVWTNAEDAERHFVANFGPQVLDSKLKSPAQLIKMLKDHASEVEGFITMKPTTPSLKKIGGKR